MMSLRRTIGTGIALAAVVWVTTSGARASNITDGVEWLEAHQEPSGLWGGSGQTPIRDSAVVLELLQRLSADSSVTANGERALDAQEAQSSDYMARKLALASTTDRQQIVSSLQARQNADGGWGLDIGYASNVLDAALVLRSLASELAPDDPTLIGGTGYLMASQNADGGWGFCVGGTSQIAVTAEAIAGLTAARLTFNVETSIQTGVEWVVTQVHADGGFGSHGQSSLLETALAMVAIFEGETAPSLLAGAAAYLEARQLSDGSWNSNAYVTAEAVAGLEAVRPDLVVSPSGITLSDPAPVDSAIVTITAVVRNRGAVSADSVLVRFFDGDPTAGGLPIGADQILTSIAPADSGIATVAWNTLNLAGDHEIFVLADPADTILEPNETNNQAARLVHVRRPADLVIDSGSIIFNPPAPESGENVTIATTVWNTGEVTAQDVTLQLWDIPTYPESEGIPLLTTPYTIPSIAADSYFTLNLNMGAYFTEEKRYDIGACADIDNTVREITNANNCASAAVWIGPQPYPIVAAAGLNLLGLPSQSNGETSAFSLLGWFHECNELTGWSRTEQLWLSAADGDGGVMVGDDFPVPQRDAFFVRLVLPNTLTFFGRPVTSHGCTDLSPGLNLLSVPNEDACYTGYSLIGAINTCTEAHSWNPATQSWMTAIKTGPDQYSGEDFDVRPGRGCFVKVESGGQWCTTACDTLPPPVELPDLLITEDDIYISPNPAHSGQPVTILVNVNNVGNVTALSPRMDIYFMNPDDGGQEMGHIYLPDIPPGESSGFYGNQWSFTGQGIAEIWGVADFLDEIEESDENNNRAFRVLQVVPEPGTALASEEIVLGPQAEVASLRFDHSVPRPIPSTSGDPSGVPKRTKDGLPEQVGEISTVCIGNLSSSSFSVFWSTDVPSDGAVHYGPTPSLGQVVVDTGDAHEIHGVTLEALDGETEYFFKIVSGDLVDDNNGDLYSTLTAKPGAGIPAVLHGAVYDPGSGIPAAGIAVLGTRLGAEAPSIPIMTKSDSRGRWILNLGNLRSNAGDVCPYSEDDRFVLEYIGPGNWTRVDTLTYLGQSPQDCGQVEMSYPSDLQDEFGSLPAQCYLSANYPNPFSSTTTIRFGLPTSDRANVSVYNVAGQRIVQLADGPIPAGHHILLWDGRNSQGQAVPSGIYFCRLATSNLDKIRRMIILR